MDSIIVFGGTFDPVHLGHIAMADKALNTIQADRCIWVPNQQPLLKNHAQATIHQRLAMLKLALPETQYPDKHDISLCEVNRNGPSYMVETLQEFRQNVGDKCAINLLMGADAFAKLNQWHKWQSLLSLANIILMSRPEQTALFPEDVALILKSHQNQNLKHYFGNILPVSLHVSVSSSKIRTSLINNQPIDDSCPHSVVQYIHKNNLYRSRVL